MKHELIEVITVDLMPESNTDIISNKRTVKVTYGIQHEILRYLNEEEQERLQKGIEEYLQKIVRV